MVETKATAPVLIRAGRPDDVPRVHASIMALARHIGAEEDVLGGEDDLGRHAFGEAPHVWIEIAEVDGAFAGMCLHFPIYSTWMGRPGVFIQDLFVAPAFRGKKVGEALLRHVANLSRRAGGVYLRLSVDIDNHGAVGFYEKLGIRHSNYEQIQKITGEAFIAFCDGGKPGAS